MEVPIPSVSWSVGDSRLGTIDASGTFTPRAGCRASGRTTIGATSPNPFGGELTGDGEVTVRIEVPAIAEGVTLADAEAAFARPEGSDPASPIRYPLDGVLLPNNIAPLHVQWDGGASGDVYRITIENDSLRIVAYRVHDGPAFAFDWTPARDLWNYVSENSGGELSLQIDRATATSVSLGTPIRMRMARSGIAGAVYYWGLLRDTSSAHFERISAATGEHERIIPNPPTPSGGGGGCVGCHTVSRDGRFLAANLNGGSGGANEGGAMFDLTRDLSGSPAETVFPTWPREDRFWFSAVFNPDATRLFITSSYAIVIDPSDGSTVPATGLPPRDAANAFYSCDWSPDGSTIAMTHIDTATSTWAHLFTHGDLVVMPALAGDAFGPLEVLHRADDLATAPEGGRVDVHPAFTPDSRYVAFQHSTWARTVEGGASTFGTWTSSALYLIARDGSTLVRLDNAVAGTHGHRDYWPTFAPFASREPDGTTIMWLAFTSGRDYGNARAGTAAAPDAFGRQLWVTALTMPGGEFPEPIAADPSHAPFWLPGQNTGLENLGAYWAGLACRASDDRCEVSSECCSAYCAPDATGAFTCQPPPPDRCRAESESCGGSADCCVGYTCVSNTCVADGPI
jgi:hypothetical protein